MNHKPNLSNKNFEKFSTVKPPKRGANKESLSDAKNMFNRAMMDNITENENSMTAAYRVGVRIFNGCCYVCDKKLYNSDGTSVTGVTIHADHVVSPLYGGVGTAGNMLAICANCNMKKKNTYYEDFLKNKPETIKKIKEFQKLYDYSPIDCDKLPNIKERISLVFEIAKMLFASSATNEEIRRKFMDL